MNGMCERCGAINAGGSKYRWFFVGSVACCGKCGSTKNELNNNNKEQKK